MQELIEQVKKEANRAFPDASGYPTYLTEQKIDISREAFLSGANYILSLLSGSILPSQFVNGEPTEDGEYVCRVEIGEETDYRIITWNVGAINCLHPVLSHCKLP